MNILSVSVIRNAKKGGLVEKRQTQGPDPRPRPSVLTVHNILYSQYSGGLESTVERTTPVQTNVRRW